MATIYLDNCTLATSVSNILTSSRSHHNRLMTCCLCLTMPHVSKISIISQVSPCLGQPEMSWLVSCLDTCVLANLYVSEKCFDSITSCMTRLITLSPTFCQLPPSHNENRRFHPESALAGIGLYRVRHVFFFLFATAPTCHICHVSHAPPHRRSFLYMQLVIWNI